MILALALVSYSFIVVKVLRFASKKDDCIHSPICGSRTKSQSAFRQKQSPHSEVTCIGDHF